MFWQIVIVIALVYYVDSARVGVNSTTSPAVDTRFFGFGNGILAQLFHDHNNQPSPDGFGGSNQVQYPVQQQNNWLNDRRPQQFPSQGQDFFGNSGQYPIQSNQGNFGEVSNQHFNTGTLDDIPLQSGGHMQNQNFDNQGLPTQNSGGLGLQNQGFQNQNGGSQGFQNQNGGNQGSQNQNGGSQGFQNQNGGNQGFQNLNPVAILGKPVPVPPTSVPDGIVFQDGLDTRVQIQCVQDCRTTTEYNPVCGSNNITYFNPGRFVCARNCGTNVFLGHPGRCFD